MQRGHDRLLQAGLDRDAVRVHRHVHHAVGGTQERQGGDQGGQVRRQHGERQRKAQGEAGDARDRRAAEPGDDTARQQHRAQRADRRWPAARAPSSAGPSPSRSCTSGIWGAQLPNTAPLTRNTTPMARRARRRARAEISVIVASLAVRRAECSRPVPPARPRRVAGAEVSVTMRCRASTGPITNGAAVPSLSAVTNATTSAALRTIARLSSASSKPAQLMPTDASTLQTPSKQRSTRSAPTAATAAAPVTAWLALSSLPPSRITSRGRMLGQGQSNRRTGGYHCQEQPSRQATREGEVAWCRRPAAGSGRRGSATAPPRPAAPWPRSSARGAWRTARSPRAIAARRRHARAGSRPAGRRACRARSRRIVVQLQASVELAGASVGGDQAPVALQAIQQPSAALLGGSAQDVGGSQVVRVLPVLA